MKLPQYLAVVILCAVSLEARADLVSNGSFEMGSSQPTGNGLSLPNGSTVITDWTVFGGPSNDGLAWLSNGNGYGVSTPFGTNFVDLTGYHDNAPYFGLSQTLNTLANQAYVLTFDLGVDNSNGVYSGPIGVTVTTGSSTTTISNYNPIGTGNIWQQFTVDFTASSTSTLLAIQGYQGDQYIGLDNVSVNAVTVPEPSSLLLALSGTGLAGLFWRIRGRKERHRNA